MVLCWILLDDVSGLCCVTLSHVGLCWITMGCVGSSPMMSVDFVVLSGIMLDLVRWCQWVMLRYFESCWVMLC